MPGTKIIVETDDVRKRYVLESLTDINNAIDSGLIAATIWFQGVLGSVFEENLLRQDVFHLDEDLFTVLLANQFRLRLKQAFVRSGTVSIKFAESRQAVLDAAADTVPVSDYYVDYEKGLVFVDADGSVTSSTVVKSSYRNKFLLVTYSAGFDTPTNESDPPQFAPPDWLKEAVLAWMASVLVFTSNEKNPDVARRALEIQNQAARSVERFKRETAYQVSPIY